MTHRHLSLFIVVFFKSALTAAIIALLFAPFAPLTLLTSPTATADAATVAELQQQINDRNQKIADLEREIAQYQNQVTITAQQAKTLKNLISTLDTTRKKLDADIAITQNKIAAAGLTIQSLSQEIKTKENTIDAHRAGITELIQNLDRADQTPLIISLLNKNGIAQAWDEIRNLTETQNSIRLRVLELESLKKDLSVKRETSKTQESNLKEYNSNLSDQKKVVVYNTQEKNKLLAETKNQEANYQKLLADKKALRDAFQKELTAYESQLKLAIDPNSYPQGKNGILSWPLANVNITQYFGNTEFSAAHAQLYNGTGHNGIDLGTPTGTPVKAALSGTIIGTGDTDLACPGASFGRWILIRHNNGLSSLYGHLSVISVKEGQAVNTGETIGYSGNTGYSTGPHLHFTVYASQGVQVVDRASKSCGGRVYHMPVADLKAYLNPIEYLPAL